jgi:hypothetical protein
MPNRRTNLHINFINSFVESELIEVIEKYRSISAPTDILPMTNPIARFLEGTTYVKYGSLYSVVKVNVPGADLMYSKLASALVKRLEPEFKTNPAYRDQVMKKLLHRQFGPMLSTINELLAAAYYKYLGLEVSLNSSKESGAADVDLIGTNYATDAKLYPNNQIRLEAIVNESAEQLLDCIKSIKNTSFLFFVKNPDKKLLHKSMAELGRKLESPADFTSFDSEALHVIVIDDNYPAADYPVRIESQNVNIYIQQNWPLDDSVEEMKRSIEKATKQAEALGKEAIPWIMVPGDADRNGITVQVLRHMAGFHPLVMDNERIYVMPVFSFGFDGAKVTTIFDVYQTGSNTLNINDSTFQKFFEEMMNEPIIQYK